MARYLQGRMQEPSHSLCHMLINHVSSPVQPASTPPTQRPPWCFCSPVGPSHTGVELFLGQNHPRGRGLCLAFQVASPGLLVLCTCWPLCLRCCSRPSCWQHFSLLKRQVGSDALLSVVCPDHCLYLVSLEYCALALQ